jgi:hypothetical protein
MRSRICVRCSVSRFPGRCSTGADDPSLRFLRTRSFLVRYANLGGDARTVMTEAFERPDASGRRFSEMIRAFGAFIDRREASERERYVQVLAQIEVGDFRVRDMRPSATPQACSRTFASPTARRRGNRPPRPHRQQGRSHGPPSGRP